MNSYKIASPISHFFTDDRQARAIIEHSDCLECRDRNLTEPWAPVLLFHTDVEPIHHLSPAAWAHLQAIGLHHPKLQVLSMHLASCCSEPRVVAGRFQPGGKTYNRAELLATAKENLGRIRTLFGPTVRIAVENNNYYPTPAYDHVCDAEFIADLVRANDLVFLFDIAHAHITAANRGIPYQQYRNALPLEKLVQVHLSQHGMRPDGTAFDAHDLPGTEMMGEFRQLLRNRPIEFVTVEYYREMNGLISLLTQLNAIRHEPNP